MFWTALLAVCAFICILISFMLQGKQTNETKFLNRQTIYIQNRTTINNIYQFTADTDQGIISFENSIPIPIGSYIEAEINNGKISIYSEKVQKNQIFRVLNIVEKWRYIGVLLLLSSISTAIMKSDKFEYLITGFCIIIAMAIAMLVMIRSRNNYLEYCNEEKCGNIVTIPYKLIAIKDGKAYITYHNETNANVIAVFPKRYIKTHPNTISYHTGYKSIIFVSKKLLRVINIISLICSVIFSICLMLIFYWYK